MNAFYAFEYDWNKSGLTLDKQIVFFENNWTYFLGFGLPLTIMLQLIPPLYTTQAFAILLPSFVIFSTQSRIFETQTTQPYRLPYFWVAKRLPTVTTYLCKRKLKNPLEPKLGSSLIQTQKIPQDAPLKIPTFPDLMKAQPIETFKQPMLLHGIHKKRAQPFLSEDEDPIIRRDRKVSFNLIPDASSIS